MLINFIIDIFEETAWRGYLTSQLLKFNLNDRKLYLIVGCVWVIWHIPYYMVFLPLMITVRWQVSLQMIGNMPIQMAIRNR
ncbi:MAG: CPBP family glutamic-type intramembrane protease [Syntrophomonas sp.]|nr:CPBP family glutamic-type intramembrane protease [Syntrophomonas sp.]